VGKVEGKRCIGSSSRDCVYEKRSVFFLFRPSKVAAAVGSSGSHSSNNKGDQKDNN